MDIDGTSAISISLRPNAAREMSDQSGERMLLWRRQKDLPATLKTMMFWSGWAKEDEGGERGVEGRKSKGRRPIFNRA